MPKMVSVLIIDADRIASGFLSWGLRRLGLSVDLAESGADARGRVAATRPDAMVIEQILPDGSGLSLLPRLVDAAPGSKALILTDHASVSAAVAAMRAGAASYLAKPADAADVVAELGFTATADRRLAEPAAQPPVMTLEQVEWEHINRVLLSCDGNISEAARLLNMHRRTLQRKLARGAPPVAAQYDLHAAG